MDSPVVTKPRASRKQRPLVAPDTAMALTVEQAAELLQVSRRCLMSIVKRGTIRPARVGRLLRFRREDLEAFLAASTRRR